MGPDELAYYRERALIEKRRAAESTMRLAADIHLKLAGLYESVVEVEEQYDPTLRTVEIGHPLESHGSSVSELIDGPLPS